MIAVKQRVVAIETGDIFAFWKQKLVIEKTTADQDQIPFIFILKPRSSFKNRPQSA